MSRYFKIALVREIAGSGGEFEGLKSSGVSYARVPFHDRLWQQHHGTCHPLRRQHGPDGDGDKQRHNAILPTQAIAERYDIIINSQKRDQPGDKLAISST